MIYKMFRTNDAWHIVEEFTVFITSGLSKEESYTYFPNQTRNYPFAINQVNIAVKFQHWKQKQVLRFCTP